eukprot:PLAT6345.1.p1 GENE.PLAT6345.1~~PLAT6345.1.p1  ORF type:complete len:378 (+),score=136.13 PLAT6345.1:132-1136(+)
MQSIFVSIASYRDPECQHTVASLLRSASHPERVFIGICWQFDADEDKHCFTHPYPLPEQVRVVEMAADDAAGPCVARALAQSLYDGEDYYLQLDSHMRFSPGWDDYLISQLAACPAEKAVLTAYPMGYKLPDIVPDDSRPMAMCARTFGTDGFLRVSGKKLAAERELPFPSLFWASGYSFSRGSIVTDVPYDARLRHIFFGEELSMALRMWTHGYDLFCPGRTVVYHLWQRDYRPTFREHDSEARREEELSSQLLVRRQLGMLGDDEGDDLFVDCGLGRARSRSSWLAHVDVNFAAQRIGERAKLGGLPADSFPDSSSSAAAMAMALVGASGFL